MTLLEVQNLSIHQTTINFQINQGEILAIVGPNGSGKSTLAKQISGRQWIPQGNIHRNLPLDQITYTDFTADSLHFNYQNFYYQQRYHASEEDYGLTVGQYTRFETDNSFHQFLFNRIFPQVDLNKEMIKLSSGETRKILIINTLIKNTPIYILDNPFTGLDKNSIALMHLLFVELSQFYGKSLIILLNDLSDVPDYIQKIIHLPNVALSQSAKKLQSIIQLNQKLKKTTFKTVFEIRNAQISIGQKILIQDLNWNIQKGEKWLLKGANGSGKSTLLSLLYADNPKAYSYDLTMFDRKRGSGESIWDIKKQIGFISPEIQAYWSGSEKSRKVILSGLMDALVPNRPISESEMADYQLIIDCLDLQNLEEKSIFQLSTGEKRMIMLARALVKNPPVLIIDEPFQGLDTWHKAMMYQVLNNLGNQDRTIIQVAHLDNEILPCLQKTAIIEEKKLRVEEG